MRIIIICILLLQTFCINAQNTFIKKLSNSSNIQINDGLIASDGNSIVVGGIVISPSTKYSPFVAKLDLNGDTLWTKSLPLTIQNSLFNNIEELNNTDLVISGAYQNLTNSNYNDPLIIRITTDGNIIYTKNIALQNPPDESMVIDPTLTTDGVNTYFVYPTIYKEWGFGSWIYSGSINVFKLDLNGDTLWTNKMDLTPEVPANTSYRNTILSIKLTNTGDILILHQIANSPILLGSQIPTYITKISASGTLINSVEIAPNNINFTLNLSLITPLSNGNIYLSGSSNITFQPNPAYIELDANLNVLAPVNYYNIQGSITDLKILSNGDFGMALSGTDISLYNSGKPAIARLDTDLTPKWVKSYGVSATYINSLNENSNGNLLGYGYTRGFSSISLSSGFIINADSNGNVPGCMEYGTMFLQDTISVTQTTAATFTSSRDTVFLNTNPAISIADFYSEGVEIQYTDSIIQPLCNGQQGTIDINLISNNTPYTYIWSNGTSAQDITDFSDSYTLTIKDKWGCVQYDSINLTEPAIIGASFTSTNVNCFGYANGAINLTPTGGTPGYSYAWTNLSTAEDLTNLSGGFYQVTISDTNGCQKVLGVSVTEPQQLISVVTNTTHASCNNVCDGELVVFASGGYAPYTYLWNDPMTQTTDTATALCDGQYFATISDTNGCQTYVNGIVTEPIALTSSMWESPTECGLSNGASGITPSGGTLPYSILWWGTAVTNDTITGLDFGQSGVNIVDANGCMLSDSIDISTTTLGNEECLVSVSASNQNKVIWEKPIAGNVSGYNIYRNIAGAYALIAFHPYDSLSEYTDVTFGVDPNVTSYRYKVSVVDTCGFESGLSFYHETIHLTANLGVGGEVNLIWDDYEGASFNSYNIMLDSTGTNNYHLVGSVSNGSFTYTHLTPPQDSADYIIEVVLDSTCTSTAKANHNTTRSNKGEVQGINGGGTVGIEKYILNNSKIYPNPAKDIINIQLLGVNKWSYQVFNVIGDLIYEVQNIDSENKTLSIKDWPSGMYIINLQIGNQTINKKIVKH